MSVRAARHHPDQPGPRHDATWYDQEGEAQVMAPGDRILLPCAGGPSTSRLELWPPRLEVSDSGGTYVLVDSGPRHTWCYEWVPST